MSLRLHKEARPTEQAWHNHKIAGQLLLMKSPQQHISSVRENPFTASPLEGVNAKWETPNSRRKKKKHL